MDRFRLAAFEKNRHGRLLFRSDQMLFKGRNRKQTRNRHMAFVHALVGKNQNRTAVSVCPVAFDKQLNRARP